MATMTVKERVDQICSPKKIDIFPKRAFRRKKISRIKMSDEAVSKKIRIRNSLSKFAVGERNDDLRFLVILQEISKLSLNIRIVTY